MENEYSFGEKYRTLKRISQELDIAIPFSLNLSTSQVRDIVSGNDVSVLASIKENVKGFMIRSSSPFEGDSSGGKLSGVYKSVYVEEKKDILEGIRSVIDHNNSPYIVSTHKNFGYENHPYIPIIIQPYIEGDFAGVISRYGSILYIEVAPRHNHKITAGDSTHHLSYVWKIGENNAIITGIISKYFILNPIIPALQKIINTYPDIDWTVEFTFPKEFILLQFKQYQRSKFTFNIPKLHCQAHFKKSDTTFDYEECFMDIIYGMREMGYGTEEFYLQQDDNVTLYKYFGIPREKNETFEHIKIGIITTKVTFEKVREGSDKTVFPSDILYKKIWLNFHEKYHAGIIFNILNPNTEEIITTQFKFQSVQGIQSILFYDRAHEHGFDDPEKYFFLQSIRSTNNTAYVQSILNKYIQLYVYFTFLYSAGMADNIFFKSKKKYIKQSIQKFLWIIGVCSTMSHKTDEKISGQFISNNGAISKFTKYQIFTHLNESDIQKIFELRNVGIGAAYVCSDFEPVFLPYIDAIDCLIISRSSIGSHAITIAKEYQKDILFQVKNIEKLIPGNCIFFEKTGTFIEIKICNYEN